MRALAAATLATLGVVGCGWWLAAGRAPRSPSTRVAPPAPTAAERPAATRDALAPPAERVDAPDEAGRTADAETRTAPDAAPPSASRVAEVVASLARELVSADYSPARWSTHLRASAQSLGPDAEPVLRAFLARRPVATEAVPDEGPAPSLAELVTACELLRADQEGAEARLAPLDPSTVDALRARVFAPAGPDTARVPLGAAMRSLAAWGGPADLDRLLGIAFAAGDEAEPALATSANATDALFALASSASPEVAARLAELGTARALVALGAFEFTSGWSLSALDRTALAERVDAVLGDPNADEATRARAISIVERFDRELARRRFAALLVDPACPERLAQDAARRLLSNHAGALEVAAGLEALESGRALTVAAACAPGLDASDDPLLRQRVADVLVGAMRSEDSSRRLRAAQALGALGTLAPIAPLADALAGDPSDAVRAAAANALRPFGTAAAPYWTEAAAHDASYAVRGLCRNELLRLGLDNGGS